MNPWLIALIVVIALFAEFVFLFLFFIHPNTKRKEGMKPFERQYIAHRGLFDNQTDAPENTLPAFRKAVEAGYGIELDVQRTKDGKLVVFHDFNLKRMCGVDLVVTECTYEELLTYPVGKSSERIPLFEDVLKVIDGKVPLIVEIKVRWEYIENVKLLSSILKGYRGIYCVESFHPLALVWYKKECPEVLRGQLATNLFREENEYKAPIRFALSNLLLNFTAKPDFIAYDHRYQGDLAFSLCRSLYRAKTAAWTIKSQRELDLAKKKFDVMIFDSFLPEEKDQACRLTR